MRRGWVVGASAAEKQGFSSTSYNIYLRFESSMEEERVQAMQQEEQILIQLDGLYQNEEDPDLYEQLVAEPTNIKTHSINYDYKPAPVPPPHTQHADPGDIKTSNLSAQTCTDSQTPPRRCSCSKTRCQKNYCQCFKLGLPCTSDCECVSCGNKEQLFLIRTSQNGSKCRCQKSHCLKNYCECHSSGRRCGAACKCLECENMDQPRKEQNLYHSCHQIDHLLSFNI